MYFDWQDEEIVADALETINPLKLTFHYHPVAAIGFENITDMVLCRIAEPLPFGKNWNQDNLSIIIDPCAEPEALGLLVEDRMKNVKFSVFGVAMLDLADKATYEMLMKAFAERRSQCVGEYPAIEFER